MMMMMTGAPISAKSQNKSQPEGSSVLIVSSFFRSKLSRFC